MTGPQSYFINSKGNPRMPTFKNSSRLRAFVVHSAILALFSAPTFAQSQSAFPTSESLSNERFALFIGIDKYPVLKTFDLDGCVNDALAYKRIFVDDRFGIQRY